MKKVIILLLSLNVMFLVNSQNSSTDCFGIQNGTALVDDCGICQQAYLYDFISHTVTFVTDTNNLNVTYPILLILPDDPSNPYWNSNCNDCNGIVNGTSLNDDCGECQQAYIYNFITHTPTFVNDANALIAGLDYDPSQEMVVFANDISNPYWNENCIDCNGVVNGLALEDDCEDCQQAYIYNTICLLYTSPSPRDRG